MRGIGILRGSLRIPRHQAPNHQLSISWPKNVVKNAPSSTDWNYITMSLCKPNKIEIGPTLILRTFIYQFSEAEVAVCLRFLNSARESPIGIPWGVNLYLGFLGSHWDVLLVKHHPHIRFGLWMSVSLCLWVLHVQALGVYVQFMHHSSARVSFLPCVGMFWWS